tara:strand:+ start:2314 stop:2499 length:186 start_codon:yes stop_codon:yes gene_type:complete
MKVLSQNLERGMNILFAEGRISKVTRNFRICEWNGDDIHILLDNNLRVIFKKDKLVEILPT